MCLEGAPGVGMQHEHTAAAAQRGPGASPSSCSSTGSAEAAGWVLPTPPETCRVSWRHGVPGWGCLWLLGDRPACPTFASGAVPSQFSHLCPHVPLPSAQCPVPHGSMPGMRSMRQLPPLGKAPHCPQNRGTGVSLPWRCWHTRSFQGLFEWRAGLDFSRGLGIAGSSRAPLSPETVLSIY